MDEVDQLLERVRRETHGKLPLNVYRRIYETAARRGGTFVEIGTAQGAATIAMALGARTESLQDAIAGYVSTLDTSLSKRTESLQAVFEEYARALDTSLTNRAQALDFQLVERTKALDAAFGQRLKNFDEQRMYENTHDRRNEAKTELIIGRDEAEERRSESL